MAGGRCVVVTSRRDRKIGAPLALLATALVELAAPPLARAKRPACPSEMALVAGKVCVDRWEGVLSELDAQHKPRRRHSPYHPVGDVAVRARSVRGAIPQAHVSQEEAATACTAAGKRLCTDDEWLSACRGKKGRTYPYGTEQVAGACNDSGVSPLLALHGKPDPALFTLEIMNDPRLNQVKGSLAKTGAFARCKSSDGVYDLVGNLHEWTADPEGTFRGGYYLDTHLNGDGCSYATKAHDVHYRDYSIGFRCCADPARAARPRRR